ncbi:Uncharacterized protein FKW44_009520 [Caligus rogercresseyi]|uniref:Guanylate cyclase domain-containing protein n=1 Tax=Caligus rogercresseyi TaxID=217165 RepID=A0A7T8HFP5_CALRO|nr:Uncharacterized protein FKW44_009520 [Caligus rogercresseyi]
MTKVTPTDHEDPENTSSPRRKSTVKDDNPLPSSAAKAPPKSSINDPNGSSLQAGFCQINPVTKTGQRLYMVHMLLLPFLPISALIIQNAIGLSDLLRYQAEVQRSGAKVDGATHIEKFITNMQRERSEVAFYIFTYGKQTLGFNLSERFQITDEALEKMPWPEMKVSKSNEKMFKSKLRFQIRHGDFRQRISQEEEDINSILNWYNRADAVFLQHLSTGIKTTNSSAVWRYLIAYANLLRCIENYGIAVAYGIRYYGQGRITRDNYVQFIRHFTLGDEYLDQLQHDQNQGDHYNALKKSRRDVLEQRPQKPNTDEALRFYQATYGYTEALRVVIRDLREEIKRIVEEELTSANQQQALGVAVLIIVLIISPIIIFLVRNATATIQIFSFSLSKKAFELKWKGKRRMTYSFNKKRSMPEKLESVSVLFSDIQDFTSMIETSSPIEVVILLNSLYKMFDARIDKYDVYKVNNINDSYMIVSGIPSKPGHSSSQEYPVHELSTLALDLMGGVLTVRNKMPRYRLFGDSVYVATQLTTSSERKIVLEF